jgi:hypothetical protein
LYGSSQLHIDVSPIRSPLPLNKADPKFESSSDETVGVIRIKSKAKKDVPPPPHLPVEEKVASAIRKEIYPNLV